LFSERGRNDILGWCCMVPDPLFSSRYFFERLSKVLVNGGVLEAGKVGPKGRKIDITAAENWPTLPARQRAT